MAAWKFLLTDVGVWNPIQSQQSELAGLTPVTGVLLILSSSSHANYGLCFRTLVPTFLAPGTDFAEDNFSMDQKEGDDLGMIQVQYTYCALYFYYYYISSTSDHQALDPGGWGPLF